MEDAGVGSGRKLTKDQVVRILRLAGETKEDGGYRLTYQQIAGELELHRRTVSRVIRRAAVDWGRCHGWTEKRF